MLVLAAEAEEEVLAPGLTAGDWFVAGLILFAAVAAGMTGKAILFRLIGKGDAETPGVQVVGRLFTFLATAIGLLYALSVLGVRLGPLVGALGIGGIAIAFAAQSILANFLASIILQIRHPFRRGDQILTNDCEGTVEDVNFRTVVIRNYDGERTMVPCAEVLSKPIVNHTAFGRRRTSVEIGVAYHTDLARARQVLLETVGGVDEVHERPEPQVWVKEFGESSINLVVRFWHAPDMESLWRVRSSVAVAAKRALDEAGITIAFPQRVLHFANSLDTDPDRSTPSVR